MMDSFSHVVSGERGVYVVCSDKALLDKINKMLRRQGVVGYTDGEGKLHYMVDGRKNRGNAARQINEIVSREHGSGSYSNSLSTMEVIADGDFDEVTNAVCGFYGLDNYLLGVRAIRFMVKYMYMYGKTGRISMKELYTKAGWEINLSYSQIERNVRYAISKSKFGGMNIKTSKVLEILLDAIKLGLSDKEK